MLAEIMFEKSLLMKMYQKWCKRKKNPWIREFESEQFQNSHCYLKEAPFDIEEENAFLDIDTKKAVLKASSSVVALISYTGDRELSQCSGVIIENDGSSHIVLTSTNLIRRPSEHPHVMEDYLADSLKVIICLYDGESYEGEICTYDFHFNLTWIRFKSNKPLQMIKLRPVDDYININSAEEKYLRPHSNYFNLIPGRAIVAVGRFFAKPFNVMAAPGELILDPCKEYDCKELFKGSCYITQCGEGGAIINLSGEVIGIAFYECGHTPFMPINIAHKCWEHYKSYRAIRRPSLGFEATNFYAARVSLIEKVLQKFPSICNGVLVEKVIEGSSADSAGLHLDDVIVRCGGKTIYSFMEFLEVVWDNKVGDVLQLYVVRSDENNPIQINMVLDEVTAEEFNCWPRNRMT